MKQSKDFIRLLSVYLEQLKGNSIEVETFLVDHQPDLQRDSFFTISTWVWILQKQISLQPNNPPLLSIDYIPFTEYLCEQWSKPYPSIWGEDRTDIYLSNIAMAYAALLETKNVRNHSMVQKTMTEIRDYVFSHLLSGDSVLNGTNERSLSVDQLIAVMPYGLFSPEDLVVVEAVQRMSLQLANENGLLPFVGARNPSSAAAAMFALYYLEKSDREKALYYSQMARKENESDELADVILEIYDFYAAEGNLEKNKIVHTPYGHGNVYIPQLTERIPHSPALDEYLQLTCQVMTDETVESVVVKIENESKTWKHEEVLKPMVKNNTQVYENKLSPLPSHESYQYNFAATLSSGKQVVSDYYEVSTLENHRVEQFHLIKQTDSELLLAFGEAEGTHGLSFSFRERGLDICLQQNVQVSNEGNASNSAILESGDYRLKVILDQAIIELYKGDERILATHPLYSAIEWKTDVTQQVKEFLIHWYSPESEQFYGFGERYNSMEQRGQVIDCFVYNQYRDQGTRTYMPIPFYLTNSGYGCFIDTQLYTKFDLARELKDKCTMTIEQVPYIADTKIHLYFGDYKENIQSFTNDTGKPKMIPVWALGPWMSSNNWDRESIVRKEVETTNHYQIPATVLVLEQWSDEATYYMFNDAEYDLKNPDESHSYEEMVFPEWGRWPNPKGMVDYLHDNGLKLILWQIPIQKYLNKQKHPLKDLDEAYMIEKGYVVKNEDGTPYRIPENWFTNSLIMDFSHKEGTEWWFNKRQYLIDIGVDGFKTDGGEFVFGKNLQFANGQAGSEMRNQYPNDYIAAYYDFAQQNNGITFSRAGYTGAQNFPAHWAGDERSTFAAFKRSLIAGLNAGLAGIPFWSWDLAGFNGEIPSAELFMRSSAMAAFCPIMQYHAESKAEFNQDRTPWNIAERTGTNQVIDVYRFFANVRMNLLPYICQEAKKASESGLPMMRALMVDYPEDSRLRGLYDEYLFGESLLVAPIIEEGAITRNVYLPAGCWFNLWTNEKVSGPVLTTAEAQVNQIPVYVKANTAVIFNVDDSRQLGSWVGNDITEYHTPICKIYYEADFEQTLTDHLGNKIVVSVQEEEDVLVLNVASEINDLQFEVVGCSKPLRITRQ
ncbi:glycoside hydrolase family 31 protein [Bacillus sp. 7884-1]|uniref:glycoside hydrolase family 31 protein n=1 Tax=Bacillus sp. 7884-1 TaxID=2021693 RepID=UPI000BA7AECA|nr:TIM-barrel domain-containing protein [Bacillus sp. 7884-1]PAE32937.1 glycosyl hydrolase family 31 [Bacillus sp. 7884-1]